MHEVTPSNPYINSIVSLNECASFTWPTLMCRMLEARINCMPRELLVKESTRKRAMKGDQMISQLYKLSSSLFDSERRSDNDGRGYANV